ASAESSPAITSSGWQIPLSSRHESVVTVPQEIPPPSSKAQSSNRWQNLSDVLDQAHHLCEARNDKPHPEV
ncbi:hypothetical protein PIB30_115116, partial [Stylosanthes scabra]|nr:hypothetical protein [Stylosanthes scabra]